MSERTMEALRDRINARLQTKAINRDRASAAGREVVAQCRQSDVETLEWVLSEVDAALRSEAPREAEQGPRAAPLHRYLGQRSPEGYGICTDCGARENTPEAARVCPVRSFEAPGEEQIRFPCGCVTCVCDDDEQCHGCGARSCGDRPCDAVREHFAAETRTFRIYGASDDLIETEGVPGCDEFAVRPRDDHAGYAGTFALVGPGGAMRIVAFYGPDGLWYFAPAQMGEGVEIPPWPMRVRANEPRPGKVGYTARNW